MEQRAKYFRQVIYELEAPLIYALTAVSATVGLLVYGATKIRSPGGGLLSEFRPFFGIPYALMVGAILAAILIINKRWKGLAVMITTYGIMLLIGLSPPRKLPMAWDEYFALSAALACLIISACLYNDHLE